MLGNKIRLIWEFYSLEPPLFLAGCRVRSCPFLCLFTHTLFSDRKARTFLFLINQMSSSRVIKVKRY